MKVYLDYAATTPLDKRVSREMSPFLRETGLFANPSSLHFYGRNAACALDRARDKTAEISGVLPQEVYFTSCGSESDSWALKGFMSALRMLGRDDGKVLVSAVEHHAVLNAANALKRDGYKVEFLPVDESGIVSLSALKKKTEESKTALVCVMTANNETGTIQPIEKICEIAHGAGAYFFTDAVQAAGCMDMRKITSLADMVSISAHKFYGPKGVGALIVKSNVLIFPLIDGGAQESGLRGGTSNVAGATGLAAALGFAAAEREEHCAKICALRDDFMEKVLNEIPDVRVNGSMNPSERLPGNANFSFDGTDGTALLRRLDLKGIAASAGSACVSGAIEPSHVLTAMGFDEERAGSALRFTFGRGNTTAQIDYTVKVLKSAVDALRKNPN